MRSICFLFKGYSAAGSFGTPQPSERTRRISRAGQVLSVALTIFPAAVAAAGQAPPVLNTPYVCANGITYTVTACKPYRADQWCETVEQQNGRLVTAMDSTWTSMTGRLAGCKVTSAAQPAQGAAAAPPQLAGGAQQTFNPPYLKEFPTVDQIMAQLKGASAQDTANRQLSALHEFGQMIAAMAGPRMAQNQLTPDEARIITNYFNAYNNMAKLPPFPQDSYLSRPDFIATLFSTFRMPTIQGIYNAAQAQTNQPGSAQAATQLAPTSDPGTLAARRCVELGGSTMQCMGTGLSEGFKSMIGINTGALTSSGVNGLVLFGSYKASSGLTFAFGDGSVGIASCGKMVQGDHNYTIKPSGSQYSITITNQPQDLHLTLGVNGKIAGPAAQDITGQQITGYEVVTNLKTGASTRNPVYGPITVHCDVGMLTPGPPAAPDQGLIANLSGAVSMILGTGSDSSAPQQNLLAPGPRMVGTFASAGGLKIAFDDAGAILDCAKAHVKAAYDVANAGGVVKIAVKNSGSPIGLTLTSGGTLTGAGTASVNGKLMTGLDGDGNPVLTPTSASCPMNTLAPAK